VLHLRDADKRPDLIEGKAFHNGARRVEGGMARLVDALAKDLQSDHLHFDHILVALADRGDHISLTFRVGDRAGDHLAEVEARRVVLAIPPRLVVEHVRFEPSLDDASLDAMRATGTWMATQAKVAISYDRPVWREAGQAGNAFVTHEQAVVGEIFDACDITGTKAALAGFLALSPELRQSFAVGLSILMESQMVQVFGAELDHGEHHYQDWATEHYTCSALDRDSPQAEQSGFSNPLLRRALWGEKLYLGGSETATHGAGYLEGALDAARRIQRALSRAPMSPTEGEARPWEHGILAGDAVATNTASLVRFAEWVAAQNNAAFDGYYHRLNRSLAAIGASPLNRKSNSPSAQFSDRSKRSTARRSRSWMAWLSI
jgi:monoamine oxidase